MTSQKKVTYLKDYQAPHYFIDEVQLKFVIQENETQVYSKLLIRSNPEFAAQNPPLVLNGEQLQLKAVTLDGTSLSANDYQLDEESLTIANVPNQFILATHVVIKPKENTALSGLFCTHGMYCSQCEAHGFRRMTYFIDRPDVMAKYTVLIEADKNTCPILLSNGDCIAKGDLANNQHWVEWVDPFKKPSYLFALVAGDLVCVNDTFTTKTQRTINLQIYVEKGSEDRVPHAMQSLKDAMAWDEVAYGREYDLDTYMIVAAADFNMGAMENKGLNIFNAKYILANPQTATDQDYQYIQHVIGHEYFHNWSGNRVTLRDWFQLSLKEGFTVFREQQFAAAMHESCVQRIEEAKHLRAYQFVEDAGPMAHAVRPESYIEINNFYTTTVYEKGAEVIRMLATLLGPKRFREATDLYFNRFDGAAATCDDFVSTMQSVAQTDFTQFKLWYTQAGTPELTINWEYNPKEATFKLHVAQSIPATPNQTEKQLMHIPLKVALLGQNGGLLPLYGDSNVTQTVLEIKQAHETFTFYGIEQTLVVPSLLRGFSAPVKLKVNYSDEELLFLAAYDTDAFCRWDASQQLYERAIKQLISDYQQLKTLEMPENIVMLMRKLLVDEHDDLALVALMLQMPSETDIAHFCKMIDVDAIHFAREFLITQIARLLRDEFTDCYQKLLQTGPYQILPEHIAKRTLKNTCLQYLVHNDVTPATTQYNLADNMTDSIAALRALNHFDNPMRELTLQLFYQKWKDDPLVLDKWFSVQAIANMPNVFDSVQALMLHPAFSIKNPNKVSALIGHFIKQNPYYFHRIDGLGYEFIKKIILELDALNPQMAARIAQVLTLFKRYDPVRSQLMRKTLEAMQETKLSNDLYEIVNKSLND